MTETYKRSRVDDAVIAFIADPNDRHRAAEVKRRLTRLLQTDRSAGGPVFAFFSSEDAGTGSEAYFSAYEAFAILTGLTLLEQGFPQATVIEILRSARKPFAQHHKRILAADKTQLFDEEKIPEAAQPGSIAVDNTDPTFLTIVGFAKAKPPSTTGASVGICHGFGKLNDFIKFHSASTKVATFLEIATASHALDDLLRATQARMRGRPKK